eukprot:COSAG04_NODE_19260_length_420_cov_1.582555_1_plen_139_part_11
MSAGALARAFNAWVAAQELAISENDASAVALEHELSIRSLSEAHSAAMSLSRSESEFVTQKLAVAQAELEQLASELAAKKASVKSLSARLSAEKAANGELQSTIVDQRRAWKVAATLRWSGRHGHMADINSPRPLETSL